MNPLHVSRSAERALRLLDTVVSNGAMSLGEAASATEMSPSTALRHLRALAQFGYLVRNPLGQFSSGPSFMRLALAAFRSGPYARLHAAGQPYLQHLVDVTEESAYLAVRDGSHAMYIATVESPRAIRHVGWVGRSFPLDGTAIGRSLTAAPGRPGELPAADFNTGALEPDVTAVTAPIFGPDSIVAGFSLLAPAQRLVGQRKERAAREIVHAAAAVAVDLSV